MRDARRCHPKEAVTQSLVVCAGDARSELPRILHDSGYVMFSLSALKLGRSEQVDYNWSVLTYTSCAGLALGKTVIPLCHRWVAPARICRAPHLMTSVAKILKSGDFYQKAMNLLVDENLLETKAIVPAGGGRATTMLKKVCQP